MTWPFENDTSAITKKLAQRSFKANKLRNIVAVIAIVLTSMLFTSVTTLCVGAMRIAGKLHGFYRNLIVTFPGSSYNNRYFPSTSESRAKP